LRYIISNLDAAWNAHVLTLSPEPEDSALAEFREAGISVTSLSMGRYKALIQGASALREVVSKFEPDVIHTQGIRADLLVAFALPNVSRVATLRNYPYHDYVMKFGAAKGRVMAWLHLAALRRIDVPVACSNAVQHAVAQHGIKARVVQNGVDCTHYHPLKTEHDKSRLRRSLGLPVGQPIIVSVGWLIPRKDPQTVIRGFQQSRAAGKGLLLLLGDGPLTERCRHAANHSNADIRLAGRVDNVAEYLKASDVFISGSHSEGLPNTVLEALASGLPVCLSDIPSHREIFKEAPPAGVFFQKGKERELAEALDTLFDKDLDTLKETAVTLIKNRFSAERTSAEYQSLYESELKEKDH
jgi:glycosyltransferase involved in cell wall biosynthesis